MTAGGGPRGVGPSRHRLPLRAFERICSGAATRREVALLREAEHSTRRLKLLAFADAVAALPDGLGPFTDVGAAWAVLADAERRSADVVADVLMHPTVGVWLGRALRQVLGARDDPTPLWSQVGGFHALAASAAVRTGLPCALPVPVLHGAVTLPTVGTFPVRTALPVGHARFALDAGGASVTVAGGREPLVVEPVRRHRLVGGGLVVEVVLDDSDPYREFGAPVPARPLDPAHRLEWAKHLDEAWELLARRHPGAAEELSSVLSSIVPLERSRPVFAASSADAFGCVAMSPKGSALELAEALVHEAQHSKVNALLPLVELERPDGMGYCAPWREDPRPLLGMLHGIYAFTAVVEFWRVERDLVPPSLRGLADYSLALRADQVGRAVARVRGAASLTGPGRLLVASASARLAVCGPVDVGERTSEAVRLTGAAHGVRWRLRHVRPAGDAVVALADAWRAGAPAPPGAVRGRVVPAAAPATARLPVLLKLREVDPDGFARIAAGTPGDPDSALCLGDVGTAVAGYARRIERADGDVEAWGGLGAALDSPALRERPEVVAAVRRALGGRPGGVPGPVELARWFDRRER
ncbi:HEXXH motif domain-containing protein [Actinosynnema pretiosum]|uniref:HEXXH motif domain-containing protein n=1 Tax=Actinosynnema pretiosum TaxID=42197 RepID=UPI0012FD86AC|nr:HEXXH motif domain-containing protein [Actinosynnema pretiosum]